MTTRIKLRRDTAANWTTNDPVLALGEAGYDTTNNELRVGDGTSAWSLLSAVGGTGNKITAEKTYSNNYSNGGGQTFTYTNTNIVVQMANNAGLYLNDLLYRWSQYFDGALQSPYNYSNINLVINPNTDNLASTVTNVVISGGINPLLYTITLGTAPAEPITINDIDFNYNYVNTIGLDTVNDYWGMATGDDDIDIRSGRDITLEAADDLRLSAQDVFSFSLVNGDNNGASDGIQIRTVTTSTDYSWTFGLDGGLSLPANTVSTATTTGGVIKIKGSVRTLPGDIPNYSIPGTSSDHTTATDTVIWTADSVLVTAAKITLRVAYYNSGNGGWDNTEIIELLITKTNPGQDGSFTGADIAVIGRVKSNPAYADSTVDWDYGANNCLVLLSTPDATKAADCNIYWNYDVVAFEHTLD